MAAAVGALRLFPPMPKNRAIAGTPPNVQWGPGTPDGTLSIFSSQPIGSLYIQSDAATGVSALWQKLANNAANADWVPVQATSTPALSVTSSTLTVTRAAHAGRTIILNRAAGIAVTLPAATGTGDKYKFVVGTTFTGASTIKVANATDYMIGTAVLFQDGGDTVVGFATANTGTVATESDTIDLLGTSNSTGGIKGEIIEIEDIASAQFAVRIVSDAGGTEATPFSAGV